MATRTELITAAGQTFREQKRPLFFPNWRTERAQRRAKRTLDQLDRLQESTQAGSSLVRKRWESMSRKGSQIGDGVVSVEIDKLLDGTLSTEDYYETYFKGLDPKENRSFPQRVATAAQAIGLVMAEGGSITVPLSNPLRDRTDLSGSREPENYIKELYALLGLRELSIAIPPVESILGVPFQLPNLSSTMPESDIEVIFRIKPGERRNLPDGFEGIKHATMTVRKKIDIYTASELSMGRF